MSDYYIDDDGAVSAEENFAEDDSQVSEDNEDYQIQPSSLRIDILKRFEIWLDHVLSEPEPEGIAEEIYKMLEDCEQPDKTDQNSDLYSLWAALTSLTQETKLQGRSFNDLRQTLEPMESFVGSTASVLEKIEQVLEHNQQRENEIFVQRLREQTADLLLDIRERLTRGLENSKQYLKSLEDAHSKDIFKFFHKARHLKQTQAVDSLIQGNEFTLERINSTLKDFGISEIDCVNRPFDPSYMKAVDVQHRTDVDDGIVLEIYRPGYMLYDRVYRRADVMVARNESQQKFVS